MKKLELLLHPGQLLLNININHTQKKFTKLVKNDRGEALRYLNSERLKFPYLYVLIPEITKFNLYDNLSSRNNTAIRTYASKLDKQEISAYLEQLLEEDRDLTYQSLKWIFETGMKWDPPGEIRNEYDAVLDATIALLIINHEDTAVLLDVIDLLFKRNRKGLFIHDLVFCLYKVYDQKSIKQIASYLLSDKEEDVKLALKLLHLTLPKDLKKNTKQSLYQNYLSWLKENEPYLYLTEESFQITSNPRILDVNLEAKYLCKSISPQKHGSLEHISDQEVRLIKRFNKASLNEKKLLADYSHRIHNENIELWNQWLEKQLSEQINIAKANWRVER